jgi:hypothetical protein
MPESPICGGGFGDSSRKKELFKKIGDLVTHHIDGTGKHAEEYVALENDELPAVQFLVNQFGFHLESCHVDGKYYVRQNW